MAKWVEGYIDLEGWLQAGGAGTMAWFVSSLPNQSATYPLVQDWVRGEHADDGNGRSFLWRIEADCSTRRKRILESITYQHNNLKGSFIESAANLDKWEDTTRGSVMDGVVTAICRGARP